MCNRERQSCLCLVWSVVYMSNIHQMVSVSRFSVFQSVGDIALKSFQDELEATFVQKRVLLLWLADV